MNLTGYQLPQNLKITLSVKDLELIHLETFINIHEHNTKPYYNWGEDNDVMNDRLGG